MSEAKNNHYIPQFYTSQWEFNDKQVYCLNKELSKVIITSPRNIFGNRMWSDEVEKGFTQSYLYFIDKQGDISRTLMARGTKKSTSKVSKKKVEKKTKKTTVKRITRCKK